MIPTDLSPLANHLWQSTLFVAAAWLMTRVLRRNRAAVRYGLWLAASLKFLIPFSLLVSTGSRFPWRMTPGAEQVPFSVAVEQISHPFVPATYAAPTLTTAASDLLPILLFSVWVAGLAVSAAVWLQLWLRFRAAIRAGTPLDLDVPILAVTSPAPMEPGVFGIRKPILLLPDGILSRLTPAQLQSILEHELCHVRRRDNLTAAIHMIVESIFWFHPAVWWIGARLSEERERACDEEVVRLGNEPEVYAEGILKVCKFYLQSPLACASGITGADLKKRIESIVNNEVSERLTIARKFLLTAAGLAAVAGPVLAGILLAPQSRSHSKLDSLPFKVKAVKPAGMPDVINKKGGGLLLSQNIPTQAAKPREPGLSGRPRIYFEPVPRPPEPPTPKTSGPPIESIEFRGVSRIAQSALRAVIVSRAGGAYDLETLRRDAQALYSTGRFSEVVWETEPGTAGVIVRFTFIERPLIGSVEYQGDNTVTITDILERFRQQKIKLRAETLFDREELPRATVAVQELVTEKGRRKIMVTPSVEPMGSPSTVKINFMVEEKQ